MIKELAGLPALQGSESGQVRKQPQLITASAGGKARLLFWCYWSVINCLSRLLFLPFAEKSRIEGGETTGEQNEEKYLASLCAIVER